LHTAGGAAAPADDAAAKAKPKTDRGGRYGVKLLKQSPDKYLRMRSLLGYYDLPTSNRSEQPHIKQVTISLLQTLRHLPLDSGLKKRLLNYRILSLNRDLELAYAGTRQYIQDTAGTGGAAGSGAAGAAQAGGAGAARSGTSALPGFLKRNQG
jgi:hypothetical protein